MLEITNTQRCPVQVMVRSTTRTRSFTTLIIPGRGKGNNKVVIEDEAVTDNIKVVENYGFISTRRIKN